LQYQTHRHRQDEYPTNVAGNFRPCRAAEAVLCPDNNLSVGALLPLAGCRPLLRNTIMNTFSHSVRSFRAAALRRLSRPVLAAALAAAMAHTDATAAEAPLIKRTQSVSLNAGWNAVFLEVEPTDAAPEKVFANLPVDIAAAYFPHDAPTQFVTNPGTQLFKGLGWGVWYAENRPDAFLKTLNAIYGQQAYLIHASRAFEWRVEGLVTLAKSKWQPDSFNLTGFGVKKPGAPSFGEFFAPSPAHRDQAIYRLDQNVWRKVLNPAAEAMRSGEAFWIYCKGGSEYQGPLSVEALNGKSILELKTEDTVILRNHSSHPVTPHMEHVTADTVPVPLSIRVRVLGGDPGEVIKYTAAKKPAQAWEQEMPPLEAGGRLALPFTARTAEMTAAEQVSLLKFTTDLGTEHWVPVLGCREDLDKQ
jgi:hypothetical protein